MLTLKQKIQNIFFPLGSIQKIRSGYLKGQKMRVSENSLWSPLIGGWEPTIQKIMVNIVRPNSIAYDLGANNGLHGLLLAKLTGPHGKVYNFEPLPENLIEIEDNFQLNNMTNYVNVAAAISSKPKVLKFEMHEHAKQGHLIATADEKASYINVKAISLDSFIEEGNSKPSFLKIDIEGAEGAALEGYSNHIRDTYPDMIIELHNPEQDKAVGEFLQFYGYTAYRFDPFAKLILILVKDLKKYFPDPNGIWGTVFCIGPGKRIEEYSFIK